ncbi:hypothetical protein A8144_02380 [Mycobacterium leprae 3125609]|nr:hypothetical protein A8144_02380 [Mycobacterium leprae 3125609]OAX72051.1 hypothetical protein A3216_02410 [Mycobacterium leprae 7935681]
MENDGIAAADGGDLFVEPNRPNDIADILSTAVGYIARPKDILRAHGFGSTAVVDPVAVDREHLQ